MEKAVISIIYDYTSDMRGLAEAMFILIYPEAIADLVWKYCLD